MTVPPGASALAKSGASSISGPARMLATIRSNGARAASSGRVHPVGDREQQLARAVTERHAVDRGIVARDVDRDRVDVGRDASRAGPKASAAKASRPVPVPTSAMFVNSQPLPARISSCSRQPAVVACWPVPKARPASISNAVAPAGMPRRWVGVWTKKRPARIGWSPAWLIVTQSASPSASMCGSAAAQPGDLGHVLGGRLMIEIGVDQPLVGPRFVGFVGDQYRRIGRLGKLELRDRLALRAGAGHRDPPAHFAAASFASLSSSCLVSPAA